MPPTPYDKGLICIVVLLSLFGLMMVASASIGVSDHDFHQPFYYFYRQLVFILLGVALGSIVVQFEIILWEKIGAGFISHHHGVV